MKVKLEKGLSSVDIDIPDDKVLDIIIGKDVPGTGHDQIKKHHFKGDKKPCPPRESNTKKLLS